MGKSKRLKEHAHHMNGGGYEQDSDRGPALLLLLSITWLMWEKSHALNKISIGAKRVYIKLIEA